MKPIYCSWTHRRAANDGANDGTGLSLVGGTHEGKCYELLPSSRQCKSIQWSLWTGKCSLGLAIASQRRNKTRLIIDRHAIVWGGSTTLWIWEARPWMGRSDRL